MQNELFIQINTHTVVTPKYPPDSIDNSLLLTGLVNCIIDNNMAQTLSRMLETALG